MLLNAMIFRSWFNSERHFSEAVRRYQAYGGHTVCGVFALDYQVADGMVGHLISKVRVHPKWPTGASRGTYQVAYGMVGHLISKVRVHPKWLAGWLAGWLARWLAGWPAGWLARRLTGWLAGGLGGWLAGWLAGCLAGWLAGSLACFAHINLC